MQHYVIKFVNDQRQNGGVFPGNPVSSTNKTDCQDITEIFLKVALSIITHPFIALITYNSCDNAKDIWKTHIYVNICFEFCCMDLFDAT